METKIYSSSGFSHSCSAEELYVLTGHWLSDMIFFEQEIEFYQSLIRDYFLPATSKKEGSIINDIELRLIDTLSLKKVLKENIIAHQNKLSITLGKVNRENQFYYTAIQTELEGELFDFIKSFRQVKHELFEANKYIKQALQKA